MNQETNETFVFDLFDRICPPPLVPLHFGGSAPHCPDIAVLDYSSPMMADAAVLYGIPKASYIISGTNLFMYEGSRDPWDLKGLMADLNLGEDIYLRDKQTKLSKRACGAKRVDSTKGPLRGNDSRTVSMSLRYWVEYPESSLDLANKYHVESLERWIDGLRDKHQGHVPPATFEAKLDDKCQYVGPNVAVTLHDDRAVFENRSSADSLDAEPIIAFLNSDTEVQKTVTHYMRTVGVDRSPFKVVASSKETLEPGEAREYAYNSVELNMVLSRNFNLCSSMFNRSTIIKTGSPDGISEEAEGPPQARLEEAPQQTDAA